MSQATIDYEGVESLADGFETVAQTLRAASSVLEACLMVLRVTSFVTLGATAWLQAYLENIKPRLEQLMNTCDEIGLDLRYVVHYHQQADEAGGGLFSGSGGGYSGMGGLGVAMGQVAGGAGAGNGGGGGQAQSPGSMGGNGGAQAQSPGSMTAQAQGANGSQARAESLIRQIESFNVTTNDKYLPGDGKTWCNIFASDVASSMGAELPRAIRQNGKVVDYMQANEMVAWLNGSYNAFDVPTGPDVGWQSVDAATAAQMANDGHVVVAGWINPTGGHGHMAVVRPGSDTSGNLSGIRIAQAGRHNYENATLTQGFGKKANDVQFFVYPRP